jgi:hypothetical protein
LALLALARHDLDDVRRHPNPMLHWPRQGRQRFVGECRRDRAQQFGCRGWLMHISL